MWLRIGSWANGVNKVLEKKKLSMHGLGEAQTYQFWVAIEPRPKPADHQAAVPLNCHISKKTSEDST